LICRVLLAALALFLSNMNWDCAFEGIVQH